MINRPLERIAGVVAALGLAGWIGSFVFFMYLQSTRPPTPVPSLNQTVEEKNHGKRFYVTPDEAEVLEYSRIVSWIVGAAGISAGLYFRDGNRSFGKSTKQ